MIAGLIKTGYIKEEKEKEKVNVFKKYICHNIFFKYIVTFIGMPIFVLLAVTTCTTAIVYPISWLFGWL